MEVIERGVLFCPSKITNFLPSISNSDKNNDFEIEHSTYDHKATFYYIKGDYSSTTLSSTIHSPTINWDAYQIFPHPTHPSLSSPLPTPLSLTNHTNKKKNELQIRLPSSMHGNHGPPWWSWDHKGSDLQPTPAQRMRGGDHVGRQPHRRLL